MEEHSTDRAPRGHSAKSPNPKRRGLLPSTSGRQSADANAPSEDEAFWLSRPLGPQPGNDSERKVGQGRGEKEEPPTIVRKITGSH